MSVDYAYLRHFATARDKESSGLPNADGDEYLSWQEIKHQKQKQIYRECGAYCKAEMNKSMAKLWRDRADVLYANADFDGLMQLRKHIEVQRIPAESYANILQERHKLLKGEIESIRESNRSLRVNSIREKQMVSARML